MSETNIKKASPLSFELKEVLTEFSEKTSAHGPPKIVGRRYVLAKIFWVLLFLTGVAFFTYFGQKLIITYLRYETTTDIELKFEVLEFPAVTICNLNQFRLDKVPREITELVDEFMLEKRYDMWGGESYFDYYFYSNPTDSPLNIPWWVPGWTTGMTTAGLTQTSIPGYGETTPAVTKRKRRGLADIDAARQEVIEDMKEFYIRPNITNLAKKTWFSNVGDTASDNAILLNLTQYITAKSSEEMLRDYGHLIDEMLQECTFLGKTCGPLDFYQFYDRKYGNCYTFNSGMDGQFAKITSPGAEYGLSLTLFINQPMYLPALSQQAGIRVLLHRQGETPLVVDEGFNASPGTKSAIAVKYVEIERLDGEEFTNCTHQSKRPIDGSLHEFYPGNYTQQACLKTCLQKGTIARCECANPLYRAPPNITTCGTDKALCMEDISEELLENDNCTSNCPLPCWESQYQHTISTSQWPSNNYEPYLIQTLKTRSNTLKRILEDPVRDGFGEEFVKLDIYFDNLNFYRYKEKASMTLEDLVGALGGHLGLWIGMSIISFVEVFELVVLLVGACARRMCAKQNKTFAI